MTRCPTRSPTSSPISTPPSARRRWPRPVRSASWPEPARARRGRSRIASRYAVATGRGGRPARARRHVHRQGRRRDARAACRARSAGDRGVDVPRRRAAPAPPFLAPGRRRRGAGRPRVEGPAPRRPGPWPARRLSLRRGTRPRRRDRMGEGPPGVAGRVRGGRPGDRPRRSPPGAPLRAALPALRGGQGAGRPDRLRGHARDDRPAPRGRAGDRRARSATATAGSASTSTRTRTPSSRHSSMPGSAGATTWPSSATRTRRSTPSPAPRRSG